MLIAGSFSCEYHNIYHVKSLALPALAPLGHPPTSDSVPFPPAGQLDRVMTFNHYSAMFALEDVFFEIVSPEALQYTYLIQVTRDFGAPFNFTLRGARLVPADPAFACGTLNNCDDIEGGVAFIQRG